MLKLILYVHVQKHAYMKVFLLRTYLKQLSCFCILTEDLNGTVLSYCECTVIASQNSDYIGKPIEFDSSFSCVSYMARGINIDDLQMCNIRYFF